MDPEPQSRPFTMNRVELKGEQLNRSVCMLNQSQLGVSVALLSFSGLIAFAVGWQFIGWPLNAKEGDFLNVSVFLENARMFEDTVYLEVAKRTSALSILPWLSDMLVRWGLTAVDQMTVLFAAEKFLYTLGMLCIGYVISRSTLATIGAFSIVLVAGLTKIFLLKLIASTVAFSIGFGVIALALAGRFRLAAVLTGAIGYIHPTYLAVYAGIALAIQIYCICVERSQGLRELGVTCLILFVVALPIAANVLVNLDQVASPIADPGAWFSYMQSRSDLAFPLRQGLPRLLGFVLAFAASSAALILVRNENRMYGRLGVVLGFAVLLYGIQIFFTEVVPSTFVTKLALSHRANFIALPLAALGLLLVCFQKLSEERPWAWFSLILFPMVSAYLSQPIPTGILSLSSMVRPILPGPTEVNFDLFAFSLTVFALLMRERHALGGGVRLYHTSHTVAVAVVLSGLVFFPRAGHFLLLFVLMSPLFGGLFTRLRGTRGLIGRRPSPKLLVTTIGVMLVAFLAYRLPFVDAIHHWRAFATGAQDEVAHPHNQFHTFVTKNVLPEERILFAPLELSIWYTPVPSRSVYLDWYELNYVLYVWELLPRVVEKMGTYGLDPFVGGRTPQCTGWRGVIYYRCQRSLLARAASEEIHAWRHHVAAIRRLDPRVEWVVLKTKDLCPGDEVSAVMGNIALMRITDATTKRCWEEEN